MNNPFAKKSPVNVTASPAPFRRDYMDYGRVPEDYVDPNQAADEASAIAFGRVASSKMVTPPAERTGLSELEAQWQLPTVSHPTETNHDNV